MKRRRVNTFAAFHYDVAYRKTFEGYLEQSFRILDKGLELLEKYPQYIFVVEQVILVREYLSRKPYTRPLLKRFSQEGRLLFAPGMFTMPDVNLPSGENFIRNFLLGADWLKENLGVEPKLCWMADIFGHHPQMPQIVKNCGYCAYLFERAKVQGDDTLFYWEGIDGSRILACWEIDGYFGIGVSRFPYLAARGLNWTADFLENILNLLAKNSAAQELLSPIGGDFREPQESDIQFLKEYNSLKRRYELVFSSPEEYFEGLPQKSGKDMPLLKADFNPQQQGCYSSRIRIKQCNRQLENVLSALEVLNLTDEKDDREIASLWEDVAWNAFHDIICGSLVDDAFKETMTRYLNAWRKANGLLAAKITEGPKKKAPIKQPPAAISFFNSLPYQRQEVVSIPIWLAPEATAVEVFDAAGKKVATQMVSTDAQEATKVLDFEGKETVAGANQMGRKRTILAEIEVPATSVKPFYLHFEKKSSQPSPAVKAVKKGEEFILENRFLKVKVGRNGTIVSLQDKEHGIEFADPGHSPIIQKGMNNIMLQPDHGDLWRPYAAPQNGSQLYAERLYDPAPFSGIEMQRKGSVGFISADADAVWWPQIAVAYQGLLQACLKVTYRVPAVTTRIFLNREERLLRFETRFLPTGKRYRLRVAFPTAIKKGRVIHSIPFGWTEREEGEYPAQDWMEYSDHEKGLCLLNRGLPGNNVTDGVMLLSLFRAVALEDAQTVSYFEEGEEQVFEYALRPFVKGEKGYNPTRLGMTFNRPLYSAFSENPVNRSTLLEVESDNIEVSCLRRVADEVELRLWETKGKQGTASLLFSKTIQKCRKTDFRGCPMKDGCLQVQDKKVFLSLRGFEIVTLRMKWGNDG